MTDDHHVPCPTCGRMPAPGLVLFGWHPCSCGGHGTTWCRDDVGGCGHTRYSPELDPERCRDPRNHPMPR